MNKLLIIFASLGCLSGTLTAQILQITPGFPVTTDTVEIIYDATQGNQALMGYTGDVYFHAGLITGESLNGNDWKYVVGNWASPDPQVLMERIDEDLYKVRYHIPSFYGVDPTQEEVYKLAFVFRNADASLIGYSSYGSDIFYNINAEPGGDYLSHTLENSVLNVLTDNGTLEVVPYTENDIRVSFIPEGMAPSDSSYSIVMDPQNPEVNLDDQPDRLQFSTSTMTVIVNKYPVRLQFVRGQDTLAAEELGIYTQYDSQGLRMRIKDHEKLYGTGSRALPVNRRGFNFESFNQAVYAYGNGTPTLNICIPVVVSSGNYLLYLENHSPGEFDLGDNNDDILEYNSETGLLSYFLMSGNHFDDLLDEYTLLTGKQPLPPRWSLGYIQSRYGYGSEDQARAVVEQMRKEDFPLDVLVLDLYWFGSPLVMGNLSWNYDNWPKPEQMMADFRETGVKTVLITEPYFTTISDHYDYLDNRHLFATHPWGQTYVLEDLWTGPAALLDMMDPEAFEWMWQYYDLRIREGAEAWWCDLGEPESHPADMWHQDKSSREIHNVYSLTWAQKLKAKYEEHYPDKRLFNLNRSGYAGMQRYATFPWSGDSRRSWEGFQSQIQIMLGMSMSGVGYMHSDLGGFAGGAQDNELYTRWMQMGAFSPVMRAHGVGVPTEPIYYPDPYKKIVRDHIKLRYQLLPYNYTLAWMNSTSGRPLALPMNYFDPGNPLLSDINDQYFWGENLLIAPILESGQESRVVVIPEGNWIDLLNGRTYQGEQLASAHAPLHKITVLAKAGSFIPMATPMISTDFYHPDTLMVWYFPDNEQNQSSFTMYEDDGLDPEAYTLGKYQLITFDGLVEEGRMQIDITKEGFYPGAPSGREMLFELKRIVSQPELVLLDGAEAHLVFDLETYYNTPIAAFWDQPSEILMVHFPFTGSTSRLVISGSELGIAEDEATLQHSFALHPPFPNPASDVTNLTLDITDAGKYDVNIYDITGRMIRHLPLKFHLKGRNTFQWDLKNDEGTRVSTGTYIISVHNIHGERTYQRIVVM